MSKSSTKGTLSPNFKKTSLWYVAPLSKAEDIRKNGINAEDDGFIYLVNILQVSEPVWGTKAFVPDFVANLPHGLSQYVLIEIDTNGVHSKIFSVGDDRIQSKIKQAIVAPEFLSGFQKRKVNEYEMAAFVECNTTGLLNGMQKSEYLKKSIHNLPYEIDQALKERIELQKNYYVMIRKTISKRAKSNFVDENKIKRQKAA